MKLKSPYKNDLFARIFSFSYGIVLGDPKVFTQANLSRKILAYYELLVPGLFLPNFFYLLDFNSSRPSVRHQNFGIRYEKRDFFPRWFSAKQKDVSGITRRDARTRRTSR